MAIQIYRIGNVAGMAFEDTVFTGAFETDQVIKAGAPAVANDVLILDSIDTLGVITSTAVIADHAIVRGHGGARIIQDSLVLIDDAGAITLPDGAEYLSHNSDHSHLFGRAIIGFMGAANAAALQHRVLALNGTNYAIKQLNLGTTYINCSTAKEIHFCRNNINLVTLTELTSLVDNSMVDTLHRHSELSASDGTPDACVQVNATGEVVFTRSISSATLTTAVVGPTDDLDVTGVNTVFLDCSGGNVTIGGFVGGVNGQVLHIVKL